MANWGTQKGQGYPSTPHDKLVEHDPMIVKVPMDNVDFGARKGTMAKAKNSDGHKENKMQIRHVGKES